MRAGRKPVKAMVLAIVGPTASGKTRLTVKLAKKIKGEIVSCDSMQVYKSMAVLSQAPAASEMNKIRHHLVGMLDPREEYSVASFRAKATKLIADILKRKKIPIIVGGSGLYVKALVDGLFPSPEADEKFRKKMHSFVSKYGSPELHKKLVAVDPVSAKHIHPNDARRIIRALEIYHQTGKTMTELKAMTKGLKDNYVVNIFGLTAPRDTIYENINKRVDRMFASGAVEEVKRLKKRRLSKTAQAVLGYKEIVRYLGGEYDIDAAKEALKKNTRNFAKRQWTWFRADRRIRWFDVSKAGEDTIIRRICGDLKR
jgi:tRNA dimethylallyltransferase